MIIIFATPEDVETAFYEAIARADLGARAAVRAHFNHLVWFRAARLVLGRGVAALS